MLSLLSLPFDGTFIEIFLVVRLLV